jgi:hypothetical protein
MLIAAMFNVGGWVSSVHGKIMEESKILSDEVIQSVATHEENQHWKTVHYLRERTFIRLINKTFY